MFGGVFDEEQKKEYSRKCGEMAKKFGLPFLVVLSLGEASRFLTGTIIKKSISERTFHDLKNCGIFRRKEAIKQLIGSDKSDLIDLPHLGQTATKRLADWLTGNIT